MVRQLTDARPVDEAELAALARRRGEAVGEALREAAQIDPARIATGEPQALQRDEARTVEVTLELGAAHQETR
jgi:hypothetical protein